MQANYVQRLRLTFGKTGPTRFIGHLDLTRTLERSLVRAQIPIAYSQGFNRRPRLALATALPLGFTSDGELADIWLQEAMQPDPARAQMMSRMAPGITIHNVVEVPLAAASLQSITLSASYQATLLDAIDPADLELRVTQMLAKSSIPRQRRHGKDKVKHYDLRPLILDLQLSSNAEGRQLLNMSLVLKPSQTGRPDEVLAALGIDPLAARIHRLKITLAD